ncbi:MAG: hypothetical protein KBG48_09470 [Kofleriaceae bacterium]|nr:hypothetical protein [Kofleriaceae bacterium]MBP9167605.1 hypothetical protein [Kofleriaceae bacterium]MBP9856687.1 hypothetical protein [Kofleriaceae bacterium]
MGLAERRAVKDFQDNHFPGWQERIHAAAGFAVPVEVDWTSLAIDGEAHLYAECWPKVYFEPLVDGLTDVTRDDMGREALAAGLKQITIKHNPSVIYGDEGYGYATFAGGVLSLEHATHTNVDDVAPRTKGVIRALEKGL